MVEGKKQNLENDWHLRGKVGKELGRTGCTSYCIIMPDYGPSRNTPETLRHRGNADGTSAVVWGAALSMQAGAGRGQEDRASVSEQGSVHLQRLEGYHQGAYPTW